MPFSQLKLKEDLLAVLWMDLDTTQKGSGSIYYRVTDNRLLLDEVDSRIHKEFETKMDFKTKELLVVTWDKVQLGNSNKVNNDNCLCLQGLI